MHDSAIGNTASLIDFQLQRALAEIDICIWEYDFAQKKLVPALPCGSEEQAVKAIECVPESLITLGIVNADSKAQLYQMVEKLQSGCDRIKEVLHIKLSTGDYGWKRVSCVAVPGGDKTPLKALAVVEDITDHIEAKQRYIQEKQLHRGLDEDLLVSLEINLTTDSATFQKVADIEYTCDKPERYTQAVEQGAAMIAELPARHRYFELFSLKALRQAFERGQSVVSLEFRCRLQDGSIVWTNATASLFLDAEAEEVKGFIYLRNINETKKRELTLEKRAERDGLTGFYRRSTMASMVNSVLRNPPRRLCAILVLHIDSFKKLQAQMGPDATNRMIVDLAHLLKLSFHTKAVLGRTGNDELAVFLPDIECEQWIKNKAEALCRLVAAPQLFWKDDVKLSCSIGLALLETTAPTDEMPVSGFEKLYLNGSKAMAQARANGKNCVWVYGGTAYQPPQKAICGFSTSDILEENQLIISCMASLLSTQGFEKAIDAVLNHIGRYYGAQHVAVLEYDENAAQSVGIYEWAKQNAKVQNQAHTVMPFAQTPHWIEAFNQNRELVIDDITKWMYAYPEEYELLRSYGVFSVCAIPFEVAGKRYGFLEVDNATLHPADVVLLRTLSYFITSEMAKHRLQQKQEHLIYHDALTNLCNRNSYLQYVAGLNEDALSSMGVVRLDINGLKDYNTKFGFEYGDSLLCHVAHVLKSIFADHQVYRFTGDEFLVLCKDVTNQHFAKLVSRVRTEMKSEYLDCVSFGHTWADMDIHVQDLTRHAEELMTVAKLMNKERQAYTMQAPQTKMLQWVTEGMEQKRFILYLQPKVDIVSGKVVGAEGLVRYVHPQQGIIGPAKFVPELEENGLIYYIDFFIFEQVCKMLHTWQQQGKPLRCISLNLSRMTMLREDLPQQMQTIYKKYNVPKEYIEIEITESFGDMERETFSRISEEIVAQGFRLSLDDFGAKYSNLSILSAVDLDVLKLDKSLVNDIVVNKKTLAVVSNFLLLCRNLGIESVAEGVETEEQMTLLKQLGCDIAQGYLINKPMPTLDFEEKYCC